MKAIILAAGRGSRMKNLTDENHKCLIELQGKPLIEWQIMALQEAGIEDIAIVTGYRNNLLEGRVAHYFHNERWAETQMLSSLACAREWLDNETCIVSYSDIFYHSDGVRDLIRSTGDIAITYDPNWRTLWEKRFGDPLLDAETFRLNPDQTLAEIGNKPETVGEIQGQYMGLLKFTPVGWAEVERIRHTLADEPCDKLHMTGMLQYAIKADKIRITTVPYIKEWGELDTVDDLLVYRECL